jgi:serine protease Do
VIGVNTAIQTGTGYYVGYGFAIPINEAKKAMGDFIQYGHVVRAYLGIEMRDIDEKLAEALKLDRPVGVFIDGVIDRSPAERAGIEKKDVIIKLQDQEIDHSNQVQDLIFERRPGDRITLTVIRNGKEKRIEVVLGELKSAQVRTASMARENPERPSSETEGQGLGMTVQELTDELAEELGYKKDEGVVVSDVERFGPASKTGIREGDLIMEIDNKPVKSVKEFEKIVSSLGKGKNYLFYIKQQDGQKRFVPVEVPKK